MQVLGSLKKRIEDDDAISKISIAETIEQDQDEIARYARIRVDYFTLSFSHLEFPVVCRKNHAIIQTS